MTRCAGVSRGKRNFCENSLAGTDSCGQCCPFSRTHRAKFRLSCFHLPLTWFVWFQPRQRSLQAHLSEKLQVSPADSSRLLIIVHWLGQAFGATLCRLHGLLQRFLPCRRLNSTTMLNKMVDTCLSPPVGMHRTGLGGCLGLNAYELALSAIVMASGWLEYFYKNSQYQQQYRNTQTMNEGVFRRRTLHEFLSNRDKAPLSSPSTSSLQQSVVK